MKKVIPILLILITLSSCSTVLLTGRRQLNLVSDAELNQMSFTAYTQLKDSIPLSSDKTNTAMVKRVGDNLRVAVEKILKANGAESEIQNFRWEYNLFKVNQVNAFAMPGGKVAVFDGILPKTLNESGMAVVVGHEIAHVVAKHSAERLSQQIAAQYGGSILGAVVGGKSAAVQQGIGALYGIGVQTAVLLPYSRKQEYEADHLGLIIMAVAGYNPNEAITFWQRMTADKSQASSDFMSTHPSDDKRIAQLKVELAEAMKYYKTGVIPVLK
ncbi:MAG: M48 family metallopeptidase [Paludibacteraceae bacterium]